MNVANKILNKQRRRYVSAALQGLLLAGLGIYIGIMLLVKGLGDSSQTQNGKVGMLYKLMKKLLGDRSDLNQIMAYGMAALMLVAALCGLYYFIKGAYHMLPKHTPLGKSILLQAKYNEKLSDMLETINNDIEREAKVFGSVYIGREWILELEAMRISGIQGVFWMDEGESDFVLCCVDDAQNIWASSFSYKDDRDNAVEYLRSRYPQLAYGDKATYIAFRKGQMGVNEAEEEEKEEEEEKKSLPIQNSISESTVFNYIKTNGIPTSNFTNQEVLDAFQNLVPGQKIALRPLDSSIEEFLFHKMSEGLCEVTMIYLYRGEEGIKTVQIDEYAAKDALENLLIRKKNPDFLEMA